MSAAMQLGLFPGWAKDADNEPTSANTPQHSPTCYPQSAGYKQRGGASQAAAQLITPRISGLRRRVLEELKRHPYGLTADEIAQRIGKTEFSVRPRVTELVALGKVQPTGQRRQNRSGMTAAVWRVAP